VKAMSDYKRHFARASERFRAPDLTFEGLLLRRDRKRRNQRIAAGVAGFAIAIVAIVAASAVARSTSSSPVTQPPVRNGSITFFLHGAVDGIHPDGRQESFLFPCCGQPSGAWIQGADWSPDGTRFAYGVSSREHDAPVGVHVFDAATGETHRLTPASIQSLDWSPDGSMIAYSDFSTLSIVRADGSDRTTLPKRGVVADPSWSPDGRHIAFVLYQRGAGGSPNGALHVINADGSTDRVIASASHGILKAPAWSPDGSSIVYFDGCFISVVSPDGSGGGSPIVHVGDCRSVGTDLGDGGFSDAARLVWSPDGSQIAFNLQIVDDTFPLYVMKANGTERHALRVPSGATPPIAWQPVP
jgi:Tol biopolymer transport system component